MSRNMPPNRTKLEVRDGAEAAASWAYAVENNKFMSRSLYIICVTVG
jgi:hypothetical protein